MNYECKILQYYLKKYNKNIKKSYFISSLKFYQYFVLIDNFFSFNIVIEFLVDSFIFFYSLYLFPNPLTIDIGNNNFSKSFIKKIINKSIDYIDFYKNKFIFLLYHDKN